MGICLNSIRFLNFAADSDVMSTINARRQSIGIIANSSTTTKAQHRNDKYVKSLLKTYSTCLENNIGAAYFVKFNHNLSRQLGAACCFVHCSGFFKSYLKID